VVILGQVPVIPYATPSTARLAENVVKVICEAHGLLMANHGALTVGETVFRAWERMEILEQLARVALTTRLLGQDNQLREADVSRLEAMRSAAGHPPPACVQDPAGGRPTTARTDDEVVLSRTELVQLVADAVERFGGA
jgi:L-fuculose-phosphate aldolase